MTGHHHHCIFILAELFSAQILVVAGDGGFMMNVHEMATIHHITKVYPNASIVVMVWNDSALGYVEWAEEQNVCNISLYGTPVLTQVHLFAVW